ncbi:MAG: type IV secretory system conjugative DNA transfer family protein, partial [Actinomycetota bacterium]|nr:type IV secretory system conjugative DNA transfer family protein [Actinomycetota bacterium]
MRQRDFPKANDLALLLMMGVVTVSVLLTATAEVAGLVALHRWLPLQGGFFITATRVLSHLSNPTNALGTTLVSPLLYWFITITVSGTLALICARLRVVVTRRLATPARGMSPARDVRHELRGPGLDLGIDVSTRLHLHSRYEDSLLVLAPPRMGKTSSVIIPNLVDFPGAAVATSTRAELFELTGHLRPGPVYLFDPTHFVPGAPRIGFDPIRGCADPLVAILMSRAFVAASHAGRGVTNADYWTGQATKLLRCLFLAAALNDGDIRTALGWLSDPDSTDVGDVLLDAASAPTWAKDWLGIRNTPARERASIYNSARHAMECFADPRVVDSCCPGPGNGIDLRRVLMERATIYVAADSRSQDTIAALIAALVERLVDVARREAAAAPGGRLLIPLGLFLDEAPQIAPVPSLPAIMADGGGSGITTIVVLQSLSQARHRWGPHAADVIWNAATAKLVFGGMGEEDDLERISRLCGELDEPTRSVNRGGSHSSETIGTRRARVLNASAIRELPIGEALLLYRRMQPI